MTRPAIVIGLGGTGQWVLTYLKKDLLELNNGVMPKNVRLLAFDTVSEAEAEKEVVGSFSSGDEASYEKAPKRIGSVTLKRNVELIHIGGNCKPLAEKIKEGRYPHLEWFDVDYWERAGVSWVLDKGAGRFRQFGLLAIYKDLLGGPVLSEILKRLPNALKEVLATVSGDEKIEMIFVSSVAGGTGSAMLTPFGVLARKYGGDRVFTRATVVLPTAFSPTKASVELELRGGAALRELVRAMMTPKGYKSTITLSPGDRELENVEYSRPFDGIYSIDGMKGGQPLTKDPKYGVFPAASSWIRQILDNKSGKWFTNFVTTNRAGAQMNDPKRMAEGVFGVFGVYSLYTPARSLQQTYQLKLADQVLRELTEPVPEGPGGALVANRSPKNVPLATERAMSILNQPISWRDEQQTLTPIFAEIAQIIAQGGAAAGELVAQYASAGIGKSKSGWLAYVTSLPQGTRFDSLRQEVDIELTADFHKAFPPSSGYNPPRDPCSKQIDINYKQKIPAFLNEHYGGMGAGGADDYGIFGDVIQKCIHAHKDIFQDALRLNVLALLEDNKGKGRLGYTLGVLDALEKDIEVFDGFLKAVEDSRALMSKRGELEAKVLKTKATWNKLRCEKPTLLERVQHKYSEKAVKAEKAFLRAYAELINYVREDALHLAVKQLALDMQTFVKNTRIELERWEAMLLEGDKAQGISGLLPTIEREKNRVLTTVRDDMRSEEIEALVQVERRESQIDKADIDWALDGIQWQVNEEGSHLQFELQLKPQGIAKGSLQVIRPDMKPIERKQLAAAN